VSIIGTSQLFIVQTYRQRVGGGDEAARGEDTIFLEHVSGDTHVRLVIPPKVANAIARQRDALTGKSRSKAAKAKAEERKERGDLPGFMRKVKAV
jgi:hypothetical protein